MIAYRAMSACYLFSQIFISIGLLSQGVSYFFSNRKTLLFLVIISNLCMGISYGLLGGSVAVIMNIIAIARDSTSYILDKRNPDKDKKKITKQDCLLLVLWLGLLSIGSYFTAKGFMSLLPFFSTSIFTIAIWQKNVLVYRLSGLLTNSILIFYHIYMHNFMGVLLQFCLLCFVLFGLISFVYENQKAKNNGRFLHAHNI